ncbi:MAG TPA: hypothetical protein PLO69_14510 [Gammaproteobacteria bacterium]|nr:hypothetical protein [Gammaproteobacteria bacterium]
MIQQKQVSTFLPLQIVDPRFIVMTICELYIEATIRCDKGEFLLQFFSLAIVSLYLKRKIYEEKKENAKKPPRESPIPPSQPADAFHQRTQTIAPKISRRAEKYQQLHITGAA